MKMVAAAAIATAAMAQITITAFVPPDIELDDDEPGEALEAAPVELANVAAAPVASAIVVFKRVVFAVAAAAERADSRDESAELPIEADRADRDDDAIELAAAWGTPLFGLAKVLQQMLT